jgi:hypothetical protein
LISDFRNHYRGAQNARFVGILLWLLACASRSDRIESDFYRIGLTAGVRWPVEWIAMRGDDRLMLQTLRLSPDLQLISRLLYYRNSNVPDPPERYRGEHPGVGYITTGYSSLGSDSHMFDSLFVIAPAGCDPQRLMREIGTPLSVTVHRIERSH